jgi:hypothetical protein
MRLVGRPWLLRVALTASLLAAPAAGKEVDGVRFATEHRAGDVRMVLNNAGLLRYRLFIKAYVAALYLGEGVPPTEVLTDVPKRLEAEYFWDIAGKDFGPATVDGISKNVDAATLDLLRPRIDRFNALFEDVKPGDRYALTYLPGRGTEVSLNGTAKGSIEGADFAAALYSIWLGRVPIDENLKAALLAND